MSPRQHTVWDNEEGLFSAAMALPVAERDQYVARACNSDPRLLDRIRSLLEAAKQAESFVREEQLQIRPFGTPGDTIGNYRLLQELGEGGCGVAYLAEQIAPVKREVAVKLIKPGMDTREVVARFEAERQVLAMMDHPNIAKVFDAGVAPVTGRPYFVMELVRGLKITEYANQSRLSIAERLNLFQQVCHAIQHAHHKGVIHRDIKPSNVMVTMHDGLPIVKVIDFGLAKALYGPGAEHIEHTGIEQVLGTPAYLSPEQGQPGKNDVDTRSDIYSLGAVLYELLTGSTPFRARELQTSSPGLMRRIRLEHPPLKPSKHLLAEDHTISAEFAPCYGLTWKKLEKKLRGDLDSIVMRCIETDRDRRYQTVNDLRLDLERYLKNEIVLARPPSTLYTIKKFAVRHRVIFASGVGVLMFVVFTTAFAITLSIQTRRLAAERDRAEQEKEHVEQISSVVLSVLAAADPWENYEQDITALALLDQAARELKSKLGTQSIASAPKLLEAVGQAYRGRGDAQKAVEYLRHAVLARKQANSGDLATLDAMVELSMALRLNGEIPEAERTLNDATKLAKEKRLERSAAYARLLLDRGRNAMFEDRLPEARKYLEESLELSRTFEGAMSKEAAEVLLALSRLSQWTDELPEAESMAREAVSIYETTVPPMYPDRVFAEARLAEVLYLRNQPEQAEPLFVESLRKQTQLFGKDSWLLADVLDSLARIRRDQDRLDEAEDFARRAVTIHNNALGEAHPTSTYLRTSLASLLFKKKKYDEAELELTRALEHQGEVPTSEQYIASSEYLLGEVFLATDRPVDAEAPLRTSIDRLQRSGAPAWRAARSASALGEALYRQGRTQEAWHHLAASYATLSASSVVELETKQKAKERLDRFSGGLHVATN